MKENYETYYELEIEKIIKEIKKNSYKKVVLQFPDGLKYISNQIVDRLRDETNCEFFIYFGTCFGACDVPLHLKELDFELCIQFGHGVYIKRKDMW